MLTSEPAITPRYNIAPSQMVLTIRLMPDAEAREAAEQRWGLVPAWTGGGERTDGFINARSESADVKPAFADAFRNRRCLIPADGFYEWKKMGGRREPYYIHLSSDEPFAFAGLWAQSTVGGRPLETCTILTTGASPLIESMYDRMPVILKRDDYAAWLDPGAGTKDLKRLLVPYREDNVTIYPVSARVNSPANDDPQCVQAREPERTLFADL